MYISESYKYKTFSQATMIWCCCYPLCHPQSPRQNTDEGKGRINLSPLTLFLPCNIHEGNTKKTNSGNTKIQMRKKVPPIWAHPHLTLSTIHISPLLFIALDFCLSCPFWRLRELQLLPFGHNIISQVIFLPLFSTSDTFPRSPAHLFVPLFRAGLTSIK